MLSRLTSIRNFARANEHWGYLGKSKRQNSANRTTAVSRRKLWYVAWGALVVVLAVILALALSSPMHPKKRQGERRALAPSAGQRPMSTVPTLPSLPATTVEGVWRAARMGADVADLAISPCLDGDAQAFADAGASVAATGGSPFAPESACGGVVTFGYVLGGGQH